MDVHSATPAVDVGLDARTVLERKVALRRAEDGATLHSPRRFG